MLNIEEFLSKLKNILPISLFITDLQKTAGYTTDWRGRISGNALCVVLPETVEQIVEIVKLCNQYHIGIVPQGGNTSLCGGAVPSDLELKPQIVLSLEKLNKIISLDKQSSSLTVETGCILQDVQEYAKEQGFYFPLSLAAQGSCQIGGNIATNCGGVHVIKYGNTRDLVLGLEVVLPNGEVVNQIKKLYKNNTNFDLKQLFVGSEGTLGIITKAVLKLYPKVLEYATGLVEVESISQALVLLAQLRQHFEVCAFEIINQTTQDIYNKHFPDAPFMLQGQWLILFELELKKELDLDQFIFICEQIKLDMSQIVLAQNEDERLRLWMMREHIPLAEKQHGMAIKHDISLPQSAIEVFINENHPKVIAKYPTATVVIFGHLGDGNLHYNVVFDNMDKAEFAIIESEVNAIVYADVIKHDGSFSAEHGIGVLKKTWYKKYADPVSYELAKSIKNLIDPYNLFNPGKVL